MTVGRDYPPPSGPERAQLEAWLEFHRATLAYKCDGLSPEQLRERAVPPSTMSLLGLVRHMADVERNWFRRCFSGEDAPPLFYSDTDPDGDFDNVDVADVDADVATWRDEVDNARQVAKGAVSLDEMSAQPRHGDHVDLRWIMIHMIEEYARHNGHADLLRERIDGATGE